MYESAERLFWWGENYSAFEIKIHVESLIILFYAFSRAVAKWWKWWKIKKITDWNMWKLFFLSILMKMFEFCFYFHTVLNFFKSYQSFSPFLKTGYVKFFKCWYKPEKESSWEFQMELSKNFKIISFSPTFFVFFQSFCLNKTHYRLQCNDSWCFSIYFFLAFMYFQHRCKQHRKKMEIYDFSALET